MKLKFAVVRKNVGPGNLRIFKLVETLSPSGGDMLRISEFLLFSVFKSRTKGFLVGVF